MTTFTYQVTGMSCGHCENAVREEVSALAGVDEVQVSADSGVLIVSGSTDLDEESVRAAVSEAGYSALAVR